MATTVKEKILLQERDLELLKFTGEHETATFEQLRRKFWPGSRTDIAARERLNKLRKAGYLARYDYWPDLHHLISRYQLRKAALRHFDAEIASDLYTGKELSPVQANEAIMGVAGRLEMERRGFRVEGWISQRRLAANQRRLGAWLRNRGDLSYGTSPIPDGKAVVVNERREVELIMVECQGDYSGRMLRAKMAGFADQSIFWVTTRKYYRRVKRVATPNVTIILI